MKEKILQTGSALFMKNGVKSVTMDDLATELSVSKKTIYQVFENKSDLIQSLIYYIHEQDVSIISGIVECSENAIDELLKIGLYVSQKLECISPNVFHDLKKYYTDQWQLIEKLNREHIYKNTINNLSRGKAEGLYKDNIKDDFLARMHMGQVLFMLDEHIFPLHLYPKQKLMNLLMHQHLRSIATDRGILLLRNYMKTQEI